VATRFLSLAEVLDLYSRVLLVGGGASAIRDLGALESALAQPRATFGDEDLYPSLAEKASALGFSLILNHPFVDGNKRIGHAAVEVFLVLNGFELSAGIDDAERVILGVAAGSFSRDEFTAWIRESLVAFPAP
jgi:death-on-curing protein